MLDFSSKKIIRVGEYVLSDPENNIPKQIINDGIVYEFISIQREDCNTMI